jgi:hypothetical protein
MIRATVLLITFIIASCAGTSSRIETPVTLTKDDRIAYKIINNTAVPDKALAILKPRLDEQLNQTGFQTAAEDKANKLIEIKITQYKMRHGANRALFGSMAGSDKILSFITIRDTKSESIAGRYRIYSKNSTILGSSRGMIQDHADEIVRILAK